MKYLILAKKYSMPKKSGIKRVIFTLSLLAMLTKIAPTWAQEADFDERLRTVSAATNTIECDFILTRTMSFMASDVTSEGRFRYMRGEGISLDFTRPAGDAITMGRERFRITSGGKTSVVKVETNPALKQLQRMLTACMTGDVEMLRGGGKMTFEESGGANGEFVVTLTPIDRRAKKMIQRITLTFEKRQMSLSELKMEEASGDVSKYKFFNKKFNGAIDPMIFEVR